MQLPTVQGLIDRRMLLNYRVDANLVARLLPPPFRPKLAHGHAMAGICLIRLKHVRPTFFPLPIGVGSENAAHRFAVEWDDHGRRREGVYVTRRDTNSRFNALVGGRLFPGEHHLAHFDVSETTGYFQVNYQSLHAAAASRVRVSAHIAEALPGSSVFKTIHEASEFFAGGALGYSPGRHAGRFDALELRCKTWAVHPLDVQLVESSYFDNQTIFPPGCAVFDCALLMRNISHQWQARPGMCCGQPAAFGPRPAADPQ